MFLSVMGNRFTHEGNAGCVLPLGGSLCVLLCVMLWLPIVTNYVLLSLCELLVYCFAACVISDRLLSAVD